MAKSIEIAQEKGNIFQKISREAVLIGSVAGVAAGGAVLVAHEIEPIRQEQAILNAGRMDQSARERQAELEGKFRDITTIYLGAEIVLFSLGAVYVSQRSRKPERQV